MATPLPEKIRQDIIIDGCAYHDPRSSSDQRKKFLRESLAVLKKYRPAANEAYVLALFEAAHKAHGV